MIVGFYDRETECIRRGTFSRALPHDIQSTALRKLRMLDNARVLQDLAVPPNNQFVSVRQLIRRLEWAILLHRCRRCGSQYRIPNHEGPKPRSPADGPKGLPASHGSPRWWHGPFVASHLRGEESRTCARGRTDRDRAAAQPVVRLHSTSPARRPLAKLYPASRQRTSRTDTYASHPSATVAQPPSGTTRPGPACAANDTR